MPVIRVSDTLFSRLERLAEGFDTPANVIERLLTEHEKRRGIKDAKEKPSAPLSLRRPELIFYPTDEEEFKALLINRKQAHVVLHKADGTIEPAVWRARRFSATSHLRGNLWSGYLRGWEQRRIRKAEFAIEEKDLMRAG